MWALEKRYCLTDRSPRNVVCVADAKRIPQLADGRTDALRVLQSVTVYRTAQSCPHLAPKKKKKNKV